MSAAEPDAKRPQWRERATVELREFAILSAYLFVCFIALAYFKDAVRQVHGTSFVPWTFAAIKALVSAKFLLVGRMLGLGEGMTKQHPLIYSTLFRSITFLGVLAILTIIEEIAVGRIHGKNLADSLAELAGGTLHQVIATCVLLFLILIPYFAFRALGEVIGEHTLVRLYFERRHARMDEVDGQPGGSRVETNLGRGSGLGSDLG